jgi:hypothetical protein
MDFIPSFVFYVKTVRHVIRRILCDLTLTMVRTISRAPCVQSAVALTADYLPIDLYELLLLGAEEQWNTPK